MSGHRWRRPAAWVEWAALFGFGVIAVRAAAQTPPASVHRLSLMEALEQARAQAPALERLRYLRGSAEAGLTAARAERLPRLALSASYTRNSNVQELSIPLPAGGERTIFPNLPNDYRTRAALSVPLYTGGSIESSVRAAGSELEASERELEAAAKDLALETAAAYWQLVTARERERVLSEALGAYESHLVDAGNRARFGLAARNEVLAVQVERDRAELRRLEAQQAAEVAQADLVRLLGYAPGAAIEPVEPLAAEIGVEGALEPLVTEALDRRGERAALQARIDAAGAAIDTARAALRPQLGAEAGYDYANPNRKELPLSGVWTGTWDASLRLSWTLFDSGRSAAAASRAAAEVDALRQQLRDLDQRLRLEVTTVYLEQASASRSVEVAQRNLEAARENLEVASDRYREGVIPSAELLDAEVALQEAGLDLTQSWARRRLARASLDRAVGR